MPSAGASGPGSAGAGGAGRSPGGRRGRRLASAAVLLAVTALLGWLAFTGGDDDTAGNVLQPGTAAGAEGFADDGTLDEVREPEALRADTEGAQPDASSPSAADPYAPETGSLLVRIRWTDGSPATGVPFVVGEMGRPDPGRNPEVHETDAQGERRLQHMAEGAVLVHATELEARGSAVIEPGRQALVEIVSERGETVPGRVVDERDEPVAGADIWLSASGSGLDGRVVTTSDVEGRFVLETHMKGRRVNARKARYQPSLLHLLEDWQGEEIRLVLRDGGAALEGRVLSPEGQAIAQADVRVGGEHGWFSSRDPHGSSPPPHWARTDERGHFAFEGLPAGETSVVAWATGFTVNEESVPLTAGARTEHDLTLSPECVVVGTVSDEQGMPVAGASVMTEGLHWSMRQRATTLPEGAYVLRGLPSGVVSLETFHPDFKRSSAEIEVTPEQPGRWDPVLDRGEQVEGIVVDSASGVGVPGWTVAAAHVGDARRWLRSTRTDVQGRFRMSGLVNGPWRISVFRPSAPGFEVAFAPEVHAGSEPLVLLVDASVLQHAGIRGRVLPPEGGLPERRSWMTLRADGDGGRPRIGLFKATGEFEFDQLTPGHYRLGGHVPGYTVPDLGGLDVVAGVVTDVGTLVLEGGGTVLALVDYRDGVVPSALNLWLLSESMGGAGMEPVGGPTTFRSQPVSAGPWAVVASGEGIARTAWPVDVRSGEESEVRLSVEPGLPLRVGLSWQDEQRLRLTTELTVTDSQGRVAVTRDYSYPGPGDQEFRTWLAPGSYRVEVTRPELPTVVRDVELVAPDGVQLDLDMEAPEG